MRFDLEGLDVFFPYDYLYKEQYEYMLTLKRALDDGGHVLLEMPTGTGKTVCLISLITSYQFQHPQTGKLIYCTRTVPEMSKCMEEIKRVIGYREKILGAEGGKVLAICLSSRRNLCIHPTVLEESDRDTVDSLCRNMTASWVRKKFESSASAPASGNGGGDGNEWHHELCSFYENYSKDGSNAEIPQGIYSLDDLKELGVHQGWCPYFMTRHLIHHATILVYNYQYLLDPKVSNLVSRELEAESIVVFDEAHNIDNVCIEALSVTLDKRALESSSRGVNRLQRKVADMKATDTAKLAQEYADLVRGLAAQRQSSSSSHTSSAAATTTATTAGSAGGFIPSTAEEEAIGTGTGTGTGGGGRLGGPQEVQRAADMVLANPILSADILEEAVPGNIRKAEHFVAFLKKIVQYLKTLMTGNDVTNKTPLAFLHDLQEATGLERKPLRFTYTRLNSLLRTLEITQLDDFNALQDVANFATLVATYLDGFAVITEPLGSIVAGITEPLLQLSCLDASIAIKPVFERFQSVVITSGTLSPIDLYPKLLNFRPVRSASLPMSTFRHCLLPLVITRGSDQIAISTRYELRQDLAVIRNYGQLLIDIARVTPDGVCCFFTSYKYMEDVIQQWDRMRILQQLLEYKLIYLETKDVVETTLALDNYKRACDCGRGAVFLSVARGKVAEGIDFDRHYGRCVVVFGIPYQYTLSHVLRARLNFMRERYQIRDNEFLTFDALRQSAQCVGRVIRSKTDYGVVVLADSRYNRADKRDKFPPWILRFLRETSLNLPTDAAVEQIKSFLREMGQPIQQDALHSILMNEAQVQSMFLQHRVPPSILPPQAQAQAQVQPPSQQPAQPAAAATTTALSESDTGTASVLAPNALASADTSAAMMIPMTEVEKQQLQQEGNPVGSELLPTNIATATAASATAMDMDVDMPEILTTTTTTTTAAFVHSDASVPPSSGTSVSSRRPVPQKSLFLFEDILDSDEDPLID
mmetsp:Transcript_7086/g.11927  ORF Transcript_7086/g.11927 Transcript_7086/m.11927 type:complete len:984 (+) Transcript_7086:163-3114(+)